MLNECFVSSYARQDKCKHAYMKLLNDKNTAHAATTDLHKYNAVLSRDLFDTLTRV